MCLFPSHESRVLSIIADSRNDRDRALEKASGKFEIIKYYNGYVQVARYLYYQFVYLLKGSLGCRASLSEECFHNLAEDAQRWLNLGFIACESCAEEVDALS